MLNAAATEEAMNRTMLESESAAKRNASRRLGRMPMAILAAAAFGALTAAGVEAQTPTLTRVIHTVEGDVQGVLTRIMHHVEHFARLSGGSRAGNPSGWIGVRLLAVQRVWD
jgi:hypothetical protein